MLYRRGGAFFEPQKCAWSGFWVQAYPDGCGRKFGGRQLNDNLLTKNSNRVGASFTPMQTNADHRLMWTSELLPSVKGHLSI